MQQVPGASVSYQQHMSRQAWNSSLGNHQRNNATVMVANPGGTPSRNQHINSDSDYASLMNEIRPKTSKGPDQASQQGACKQSFDYADLMNEKHEKHEEPKGGSGRNVLPPPRKRTTTTTTTTTTSNKSNTSSKEENVLTKREETSRSDNVGSRTRIAAAEQGERALWLYDRRVHELLMSYSAAACPLGYGYYRSDHGYLCGGGTHWVSYEEVDAMMNSLRPWGPRIDRVNRAGVPANGARPPPIAWHETTMHLAFQDYINWWQQFTQLHPGFSSGWAIR